MRLREYQHEGHPDVASQYSRGWFDMGTTTEPLEAFRASLENEAGTYADHVWEIEEEELSDSMQEVSLRVEKICDQDDHDSDECLCWEYVHAYRLEEE